MKIFFLFFSLICSFLLCIQNPCPVFSETDEEKISSYKLGEIIVTADKIGIESVGTVREVTSADIEREGARTLDEALQLLPGIIIRTGTDGVPRIDLRGFRSRHVILLLDGIPFNSTFDGQFDPTLIPVENIAKIKVNYGNHSVLYGDGGLGGIINIITKAGEKGFQGSIGAEAGEGDNYLSKFDLSGGGDMVNFFLSGNLYERNGFPLSDDFKSTSGEDGDLRENSDKRRKNFFTNVNFTPNDKVMIGAVFNYVKGEFGKPPSTIDDPDNPFADAPKYERVDDSEGYAGHLSLSYSATDSLDFRSWIFFNQLNEETNRYDDNRYNSMDDPKVKGTFHEDAETTITGISFQANYNLNRYGLVSLGLSGRTEDFENEGVIRDVKAGGGNFNLRNFRNDTELDIYSAALEYEVSPLQDTMVVLGYSHHWLDKEDNGSDDEGSYLIGGYYDIFQGTRIKASYARKIRFPSIRQLYEEVTGNPDLTTEKSDNYEVGVEHTLPLNSNITLTGFLIDVDDYIEKDDATDRFQNNEKYRFQGIELTAQTRFVKNLLLAMGYTYLDTEDKSSGTEKEELQYRPRHKFTMEGKYVFDFGLAPYISFIHVADQYFYSKKIPLSKRKLNEFTLVNVKLDQILLKGKLRLYLGVDNLFDVDYEESYGFPQAGRFIYGGVAFNL